MTDSTISQDAQEFAAQIAEAMQNEAAARQYRRGEDLDKPIPQILARFEAHLRTPAGEAGEQPPPYTCKHGCERDEIIERLSATDTEAMRLLLREAVMRGIKQPSGRDYASGDDFRDALRDYDAFIARIDALAKGGA